MKTSLPLSTISYNTDAFLRARLDELIKAGKLVFWAYIKHDPEPSLDNDDGNGKEHRHVYFELADSLDPQSLREYFVEFDPTHPTMPLGCQPIRKSKFEPWFLYVLHNREFLAKKGLTRALFYTPDQVVTSDADYLHSLVVNTDFCKTDKVQRIFEQGLNHAPLASLVQAGVIGLRDMHNAKLVYEQGYNKAEQEEHEKNLSELQNENADLLDLIHELNKRIAEQDKTIEYLKKRLGITVELTPEELKNVPF